MRAIIMSDPSGGLTVEDAHFSYGGGEATTHALRGVSVRVDPGETLLIRGPSGSGKTTLLQLMGALRSPDQGSVCICGEPTTGRDQTALRRIRLRHVGFIFQFFNLFPTLTALENVAVPLDIVGVSRDVARERARAMLHDIGLSDRLHHLPGQLSGGQRQRVAIARALINEPHVVLADEPTAALDSYNGALVVDTLRRLAKEKGRIVVLVSHDQRLEDQVDRIVSMEDGAIVQRPSRENDRSQFCATVPMP